MDRTNRIGLLGVKDYMETPFAALALAAVLLNWITTGDHLFRSLSHHHLWPIAGMDLLLLAGACLATIAAVRISRRQAAPAPQVRHA
ncbi:hypothetical protein BH11PSE3_BH11PSE3_51530 [soil metagenome]